MNIEGGGPMELHRSKIERTAGGSLIATAALEERPHGRLRYLQEATPSLAQMTGVHGHQRINEPFT